MKLLVILNDAILVLVNEYIYIYIYIYKVSFNLIQCLTSQY
jgi:hypothetical protein